MNLRFCIIFCLILDSVLATKFVSLKSSKVNLRVGPGTEYPILWVLMSSGLPLELISEYGQWRKVRCHDGTEGWVNQNMISGRNTAIVIEDKAILYKYASDSYPIAIVEKKVTARVLEVEQNFVKVDINKIKGWIKKENLWGINEDYSPDNKR